MTQWCAALNFDCDDDSDSDDEETVIEGSLPAHSDVWNVMRETPALSTPTACTTRILAMEKYTHCAEKELKARFERWRCLQAIKHPAERCRVPLVGPHGQENVETKQNSNDDDVPLLPKLERVSPARA